MPSASHTAAVVPSDEPIALPDAWTAPARAPLPVLASIVPVAGAVGLWLVTGSALSLWLALLGPVIAVATVADGIRATRRARRTHDLEAARTRARAAALIAERHRAERARLSGRHPDVAAFSAREEEVWRSVPGRVGALVVGTGARTSEVRVRGSDDDPASAGLRVRARTLEGAPWTIPVSAGIAVTGREVLAGAVCRALILQLCLAASPGELRLVRAQGAADATSGAIDGDAATDGGADPEEWLDLLPHTAVPEAPVVVVAAGPGDDAPRPASASLVAWCAPGAPVPSGCAAVLTVDSLDSARLDYAGEIRQVAVEAVSREQAAEIARELRERSSTMGLHPGVDAAVRFADLPQRGEGANGGLAAVIGRQGSQACVVDLVADGPHAVVAGVTGSGKSELLITWVLAMCATRSTEEVAFLLADFKGGTAFDALATVPHVTGVLTDLDGSGARRAIESLQAEVRWRERELAAAGARDIRDPRARLPRLVIVVDEFAALLAAHPDLQAVFTDVAARGRALGMHLVLGTQRVAGVVRESLLANCPLRISLRVTDGGDSRAVVGTDGAALLPGGAAGAGRALVRRAADASPREVRIALATADDIARVAARPQRSRPRRPWLPALPARVMLDHLAPADEPIRLGLVDEPARQRQVTAGLAIADQGLLVVGGAGSGRTTVLATIRAQHEGPAVVLPADGEVLWDTVAAVSRRPLAEGTLIVADDLDALTGLLPPDYAAVVLERLERLVRGAGSAGILVVASVRRVAGPTARLAELLPRRALLALPSRTEHVAAGGDGAHHRADAPPGRGRIDGREVQFALPPDDAPAPGARRGTSARTGPVSWTPSGPTALVARRSFELRETLAVWARRGVAVISVDDAARAGADALVGSAAPHVVVGSGEEWQRAGALLGVLRGDHDLVVDAGCAAEYRLLTGDRDLPPYCAPGARRAWLRTADGPPQRIVLPRETALADAAT